MEDMESKIIIIGNNFVPRFYDVIETIAMELFPEAELDKLDGERILFIKYFNDYKSRTIAESFSDMIEWML